MAVNVLVAPSGFKESLDADHVAACIARGVRRADPTARIDTLPVVDGGEGTARVLAEVTGGRLVPVRVTGPVGDAVDAHFALLGGDWQGTAVVEIAQAAGLRLVPGDRRDPLKTTTKGVGELIRAALDAGAERVVVGCGDSGTNDAGAGAAQALGVRLLDVDGQELGPGGGELRRLARIDTTGRDPRIGTLSIEVACNWSNVLCGPNGVARTFGPQKGAGPEEVVVLEQAIQQFASVVHQNLGIDARSMPGGGASGGLGAGLHALMGATLLPRYDVIFRHLDLETRLDRANVVITAEGRIDGQTANGKVPAEIARRAMRLGVPVVVLVGAVGDDARDCLEAGIDAYECILTAPCTLADAIRDTPALLEAEAEQVWRLVRVGIQVGSRAATVSCANI